MGKGIKNLRKRISKDISVIRKELRDKRIELKKFKKRPTIGQKLRSNIKKSPVLKKIRKRSRIVQNNIQSYFNPTRLKSRVIIPLN